MRRLPTFTPSEPPCSNPGCQGTLEDHLTPGNEEFFQRCRVCGGEVGRMLAEEKLAWAIRTVQRALRGEDSN